MKQAFLEILQCPSCGASLRLSTQDELCCTKTPEHVFPIFNGIPYLFPFEQLNIWIEEANTRLKKGGNFSWAAKHWNDLGLGNLLGDAPVQGSKLLSYGSGYPEERKYQEGMGYDVIAFDIYPADKTDLLADGHQLPFKDSLFDVVTAFEVLEHLPIPWRGVQEIARVLVPGGRFVGSVAFMKGFHSSYFHMTHWGIQSLLESAGLKVDEVYGGQNIFQRTIAELLPFGPFSNSVYGGLNSMVMWARRTYWTNKTGLDPVKPQGNRFDSRFEFSFNQAEALKYSPTVIFSATKLE